MVFGMHNWHFLMLMCMMLPFYAVSQQYNYRHYTTRDGLPSSTVYAVTQDEQGYIWFATSQGASRFDGYTFNTITVLDGLPDNDVLTVINGKGGKLWFVTFSKKLSYYDLTTGEVKIFDKYSLPSIPLNIQETDDGVIYIGTNDKGLCIVNDESTTVLDTVQLPLINNFVYPYLDNEANLWISGRGRFFKFQDFTPFFEVPDSIVHWDFIKIHQLANDRMIFFSAHHLLEIIDNKIEVVFSTQGKGTGVTINHVESDRANNILVSTQSGAFLIPADTSEPIQRFLSEMPISRFFEDNEGSYWFTTLNEGVFMLPSSSRKVKNYNKLNGLKSDKISSFFTIADQLYFANKNGVVGKWQGDSLIPEVAGHFMYSNLQDCVAVNDSFVHCSSNYGALLFNYSSGSIFSDNPVSYNGFDSLIKSNSFSVPLAESFISMGGLKSIATDGDKVLWLGGVNGLLQVNLSLKQSHVVYERLRAERITAVCLTKNKALWFSTIDSIGVEQPNGEAWMAHADSFGISGHVIKIFEDPYHNVWFATSGQGLFVYANNQLYNIAKEQGLASDFVTATLIHGQQLIVGTTSGLSIGTFKQKPPFIGQIFTLSVNDALLSDEVNDVAIHKNMLYIGTNKGLSVTSTNSFTSDTVSPKVNITRFQINERDTTAAGSYVLPNELNSLKFEYVGLLYKADGKLLYRYQMEGVDTGWVQTIFTNVQYPNLPPGNYTFKVDSRSAHGPWSGKPRHIQIKILPPYWQTWWFRLMLVLFGLGLVTAISYSVIRYYRNKSFIAQRLVELEGNALRANMNPHFVFNALNAIHDFIANSDEKSAHIYLGKFAKLIRRILDQSRKNFISLDEELDTLTLYLDLENMRFEHKFRFEINIEDGIQPYDIELPPMLIQPYLENAVRHGLMNLDRPGEITVHFSRENKYLKCTIIDNGVGRAKALEISSNRLKGHRSAGMDITQKRVELLHAAGNEQTVMGVEVIDIIGADDMVAGTQVSIMLPLKEL